MNKEYISDSQLVILLKEEQKIKSFSKLGRLLGMTDDYARTYVNDVKNGRKKLASNWKLEILKRFPRFSEKYLLNIEEEIENIVNEPKSTYSNQIKEKMRNLEEEIKNLRSNVNLLNKQVALILDQQSKLI